ncbi:MAG: asparagine synthase (glutamine-hydrolyzing) [Thiohalocapsa sp.]
MCGLAGFTSPGPEARRVLAAMNDALRHRGPDAEGVFVDSGIALGHTRLAIIDLIGGAQPRVDEASGDALIFNGEIYGYRDLADELRAAGVSLRDRSDTEALFQLIRQGGVRSALERIDGMFAFAYRDGATGDLHLVRDRFGEKPLYYSVRQGRLAFASEARALLRHPDFRDTEPDRQAAYSHLLFEYLPGTASGWHGIAKLEPGTMLVWHNGRISRERYWPPRIGGVAGKPGKPRLDEAAECLDAMLQGAVRRRLVADVPVGVFLSGGVDSSLVAALMAQTAPDLAALTVRVAGDGFDETPHAAAVARHLGLHHEIVELGPRDLVAACDAIGDRLGEPLGDSSLLPTYLVCRAARQRMTVALGGDGADELFAGYPNFRLQRFAPALRLVPPAAGRLLAAAAAALPGQGSYMSWNFVLRQLSHGLGGSVARQSFLWMAPFAPEDMTELWRPEALPRPQQALAEAFAPIDHEAAEAAELSPVDLLLLLFLRTYLPDDILTKTDRASMFNSLEVRSPFLDRAVAEYAAGLPTSLKLGGSGGKLVLKEVARRYLPDAIVARKKHGFAVPIGGLLRTLLRERVEDVLLSESNPVADWFARAAIERLLREHNAGRSDHGKKLWALYVLFRVAAAGRDSAAAPAPMRDRTPALP